MTEGEDWDLHLRQEPLEHRYTLRRQNPWSALLDHERDQRPIVESAEIWVDRIAGSPGVIAVVTEELTSDRLGRQQSVTRSARVEADGHWLVRTIARTRTTDPETGVRLQGDPGRLAIRYARHGADGRRVRVPHDEGEAAWNAMGRPR
jgi:hypothetical protein